MLSLGISLSLPLSPFLFSIFLFIFICVCVCVCLSLSLVFLTFAPSHPVLTLIPLSFPLWIFCHLLKKYKIAYL